MPPRGLLLLALIAGVLLAAAEFTTIASVEVAGDSCEVINDSSPALAERCKLSGWERHGGAMLLLGLVAIGAALLARRPDRRAAGSAILVAVGVVGLGITLIGDLPKTSETGALGRDFDGAAARAGWGFLLELTGSVICVATGMFALARRRRHLPGDG